MCMAGLLKGMASRVRMSADQGGFGSPQIAWTLASLLVIMENDNVLDSKF